MLKRAAAELRSLIQKALAQGRYGDVAAIARLADGMSQLWRLGDAGSAMDGEANAQPTSSAETSERATLPWTEGVKRKTFPRFERDADRLVKIAWSKRDRAEYEHKAPRDVVDLLIDTVKRRKGLGARFVPPDILPLRDPKTKHEVPSYQAYLALAWLCQEGVMVKHGREGYSLKPTATAPEQLEELWSALPART